MGGRGGQRERGNAGVKGDAVGGGFGQHAGQRALPGAGGDAGVVDQAGCVERLWVAAAGRVGGQIVGRRFIEQQPGLAGLGQVEPPAAAVVGGGGQQGVVVLRLHRPPRKSGGQQGGVDLGGRPGGVEGHQQCGRTGGMRRCLRGAVVTGVLRGRAKSAQDVVAGGAVIGLEGFPIAWAARTVAGDDVGEGGAAFGFDFGANAHGNGQRGLGIQVGTQRQAVGVVEGDCRAGCAAGRQRRRCAVAVIDQHDRRSLGAGSVIDLGGQRATGAVGQQGNFVAEKGGIAERGAAGQVGRVVGDLTN